MQWVGNALFSSTLSFFAIKARNLLRIENQMKYLIGKES
jgi:hypothetical protein